MSISAIRLLFGVQVSINNPLSRSKQRLAQFDTGWQLLVYAHAKQRESYSPDSYSPHCYWYIRLIIKLAFICKCFPPGIWYWAVGLIMYWSVNLVIFQFQPYTNVLAGTNIAWTNCHKSHMVNIIDCIRIFPRGFNKERREKSEISCHYFLV